MAAGGDATPKKPTGKKRGPKPGSKRTPKAAAAAAGPGASASAAAQQPAGSKAVMLQFVQRGREQQQQQQQPPQRGGGISLVRGTSVRSTTAATASASGSKENVVVLSDDDDSGGGVVELQPRQQQRKAQPPPPPRVVSAVAAAAAVDPIMSCSTSRSSPPVVPTPVDITPPAPYVVPSPSEASVVSPTPLLSPFVSVHSLQQTTACADSLMSQSAVVGNTQTPSPSPFASLSETLASAAAAAAAASVKPTPPRSQVLPAFRRLREPAAASAPASAAAAAAAAAATSAAAVATPIAARRSATPLSSAAAVAAGANTPPSKKVRRAEKVEAAAQAVAPPVVPPCSTVGAAAEPAAAAAATEVAAAAAKEAWAIAAACASAVASAVACAAAAAVAAAAEASSPRAATSLTPPPPPRAAHADDAAVLRRVLAPSPDLRVLALTVCDGATRHEGVRVETGGRSYVGTGIDFRVEPPPAEAAVDGGGAAAAAAAAAVAEEVLEVRVVFCEGWLAGDGGVAAVAAGARWNLVAHDGPFDVGVSVDASAAAAAGGRRCFVLRNATRVLAVACPETGVSATEVSDALQCQRKAWLSRRCRGGRSESAPAALAGIVVHGVLQDALGGGAPRAGISEHEVRGLIERHVAQVSLSFYFAGITDEGARAEVYPFVPSIMHCVSAMSASAATEDAFGRVLPDRPLRNTRVVHAEKAVSCPHHGLRGIVDAEAVTDPGVPLAIELKSLQHLPQRGRPVMKVHHKAQLMVYLLLLKHGGGPVRSGLLAYLPKGSATCRLVGVEREHLWNELHHIVKVRNALAVALATDAVPAPYYQQVSACRYCNSREACLSLASVDGATPPPADTKQFLRKVAPGMVAPPLPDIEDAAGGGGGASSACDDTLRRTGLRQTSAYALPAQMPLAHSAGGRSYGGGSSGGGTAATTAMGEDDDDGDDDEGAVAGASWLALPRTPAQRSYLSNWLRWLSLEGAKEARLRARPTAGRSSLETGSSETLLAKHRGAVAALYAGHRHGRLRRLVADLEEPRLSSQPEAVGRLEDIMGCATRPVGLPELNCEQHAAVRHVLCSDDYAVIQGLPGTGKTSTLAVLVYFLSVVLGQRVLVVAGTNSAVDTLCLRLLGIEHMRFHRLLSISLQRDPDSWDAPPALRERVLADVASLGSVAEARAAVEAVRVVCTTAHNLHHAALGQGREGVGLEFDCVVVDEAAQMMQPLVLAALFFAPKFVLVGDHEQLPPVLKSRTAAEEGASVSLLERLASAHPYSVATLSTQYRMNSQIADLANLITYGGRLKTVCPLVSARRLTPLTPAGLAGASVDRLPEWLRACVSADPAVVFVDTTDVQRPRTDAEPPNACGVEAEMARRIAEYVLARCGGCQTAAVISPFRNQVDRITQEGHLRGVAGASVYTVDQAQGRDVDVVVVTLAKHVGDQVGDLIRSPRRINVAFTRAKRKQVCLGAFGGVFDGVEEWVPLLAWARAEKVLFRPQSLL